MIACTSIYGNIVEVPNDRVTFRPGAYGMIFQGHKLLVIRMRSTGGGLGLPGGGAEIDETLEQALQREVREETGLDVKAASMAGFKEHFFYYDPTGSAYHGYLFFFHARLVGGVLASEDEVQDGEAYGPHWADASALTPQDFSFHGEYTIELIHKYLQQSGQ